MPDKNGVKKINAIKQHVRSGGKSERLANRPDFPAPLLHVWQWFIELDAGRTYGMTANPITYTDIYAWNALMGYHITSFEVRCIKVLDRVKLEFVANASK